MIFNLKNTAMERQLVPDFREIEKVNCTICGNILNEDERFICSECEENEETDENLFL